MQIEDVKYLTVARLAELLATIPPDSLVGANRVGNLFINFPDGEYTGFIDFAGDGEVSMEDQED